MDSGYIANLYAISKTVNSATHTDGMSNSFAAGQVLFLGGSGSLRADGTWEITYRFAARPNKTAQTIGDVTGIAWKGWELVDVRHKPTVAGSGAAKRLLRIPHIVYVHRAYEEAAWTNLYPS